MMLHAELAVIIDKIRQIYAYENNPTILVSRNQHARIKAISERRPFAKRMRRRRPERMGHALRERVRQKRAQQQAYQFDLHKIVEAAWKSNV